MRKNKTKNGCEKYEQAITNYVLGEAMGMTKEALFEHLKTCKACRRDLTEWRDTYSVMKTEAYYQTPQGKAKMKRSFEDVKRQVAAVAPQGQPVGEKRPIDDEQHTGLAAGKIYQVLKENGEMPYPVIRQKTGLWSEPFYEAMGWLAREKKIRRSQDATTFYAALAEKEREQQAGV